MEADLHILSSTVSHHIPELMRVLNDGTAEFNSTVAAVFDQISFQHAAKLAESTSKSPRGSKQGNFGFAVQHIPADGCAVTHVAKPGILQGTVEHTELFDAMSSLDEVIEPNKLGLRNQRDSFRRVCFAGQLSPNNKFEFLAPTAYDKDAPFCCCHLDESNDVEQGTVLLASSIFADVSVNPPELHRFLNIATNRKSASDFLPRVEKAGPLVEEVRRFYLELAADQRGFIPSRFFSHSVGRYCALDGIWLASKANSDRCIAVSAYADIIRFFIQNYKPTTLEEVLEVAIVSGYVTEPIKFRWMVHR